MKSSESVSSGQKLTYSQMLEITMKRNSLFNGVFYFGVKTTRIFCLPSCKARKPREENLIFFQNKYEALNSGYRGCKRCWSEFFPDNFPPWYKDVLKYLEDHPNQKISEQDLKNIAGVDSSTIRRYFRRSLKMTPLEYHRKIRLHQAREKILQGKSYVKISKEFGFKSSSGFRSAFIKEFGYPPGNTQIFIIEV